MASSTRRTGHGRAAEVIDLHPPPSDPLAEQALIGAILMSPKAFTDALRIVRPDDFYLDAHRTIVRVAYEMADRGAPVDPITLADELQGRGELAGIGGRDYLLTLVGDVALVGNTAWHARIVREKAVKRQLLDLFTRAAYQSGNGSSPGAIVDEMMSALEELPRVGGYRLAPLDFAQLTATGVPETRYLRPLLPAGAFVLAPGPAESGKSIWALAEACELSRAGVTVAYISQENPLVEDLRRLDRLRPDWARLRFFHDQGLDLADSEHVSALIEAVKGCELIVLDTLTAVWSGDENANSEFAAFDRTVRRVIAGTGATVLVLDHTGHPQAFVKRRGVSAPRGASAKAQKADVVLEFRVDGDRTFAIEVAKNRLGGYKPPPTRFEVVDTPDDGLAIAVSELTTDVRVQQLADEMVEVIREAGQVTTLELRTAVNAGRDLQRDAMKLLEGEDPPRVRAANERVDSGQRARVWRLV